MSSEFDIQQPNPLLIVISGPSGAGKDTVMQRMKEHGLPFHFVVTATTRPKRVNKVHGKDYFFVSKEEFARMIEQDELIEHAIVYGDYKGIPKRHVREALASGQDVVMRLFCKGGNPGFGSRPLLPPVKQTVDVDGGSRGHALQIGLG